jgi:hypothetical protein
MLKIADVDMPNSFGCHWQLREVPDTLAVCIGENGVNDDWPWAKKTKPADKAAGGAGC